MRTLNRRKPLLLTLLAFIEDTLMALVTGGLSPIKQGVITPSLDKNPDSNVKTITPLKIAVAAMFKVL